MVRSDLCGCNSHRQQTPKSPVTYTCTTCKTLRAKRWEIDTKRQFVSYIHLAHNAIFMDVLPKGSCMSQLLAGHNAGFRVRAQNEIIEDQFTKLSDAAKEGGNYWAVQAINTLRSLTSGYNGDNVYVSVDNRYADGRTLFKIVMPGCEAYVRHESNGELLILKIQASHDYAQMQEKGNKPGYFELETGLRGTALQVTPKTKVSRDHKTVVVCGGQPTLNDARKAAILYTKAMKIADPDDIGFVHTPRDSNTFRGNRRINSRRADQDPSLLESAHIVRDLMASAQGIGKVKWMTQGAGSGIMFQALKMRDKLPLDMNGHWLYLAGATTDTAKLEELAILRGFSTDRHNKYYDSLNPDQLIGSGRLKGGDILTACDAYGRGEILSTHH